MCSREAHGRSGCDPEPSTSALEARRLMYNPEGLYAFEAPAALQWSITNGTLNLGRPNRLLEAKERMDGSN